MKEHLKRHTISFKNAANGLIYAFTTQPNFFIHFFFSLLVLVSALFLEISSNEMTILILTIVIGLSAEMINTSIESVTDLVTKEYSIEAKTAKDVSAGMMLLTASGTAIVGLIILIPHILARLTG